MSGKRRSTPEFRSRAPAWVKAGQPMAAVAAEIGVGEQLLGRWVHRERDSVGVDGQASGA
jgi:transposase